MTTPIGLNINQRASEIILTSIESRLTSVLVCCKGKNLDPIGHDVQDIMYFLFVSKISHGIHQKSKHGKIMVEHSDTTQGIFEPMRVAIIVVIGKS